MDDTLLEIADLEIDSQIGESDLEDGTGGCKVAGHYHVEVVSCIYSAPEGKLPAVKTQLIILGGEHPDQVSKLIYHTFWLRTWEKDGSGERTGRMISHDPKGPAVRSMARFFTGIHLLAKADVVGKAFHPPFEKLVPGMQFVVKTQKRDKQDYCEVEWGKTFTLDDPAVSDYVNDAVAVAGEEFSPDVLSAI
jgi:hypothetical protein